MRSAAYWRERAEEQRVIAEAMRDPACRTMMSRLVVGSERMAALTAELAHFKARTPPTRLERICDDFYRAAIFWIVLERAGAGGWPPRNVHKVAGWTVVRLVAALFGRRPAEVAADIIDCHEAVD